MYCTAVPLIFTNRGNAKLFEAAKAVVSTYYPEWVCEALPMHMMEWAQMIELERETQTSSSSSSSGKK